MSKTKRSPYQDTIVNAAIDGGAEPGEIKILDCPDCGSGMYYAGGSHATCQVCKITFSVFRSIEFKPMPKSVRYINLNDQPPKLLSDYPAE